MIHFLDYVLTKLKEELKKKQFKWTKNDEGI